MRALETEHVYEAHLSASVDLADEEVDADVRDASEERLALLRILE
jgi:hypothetical protein